MESDKLLYVADTVARERNIDKESVIEAMELGLQKAARNKYGMEYEIEAQIDRKTGDIALFRIQEVVETVENPAIHVLPKEVNLPVGEIIKTPLPPIEAFGRVAAQTARQVVTQRVREAEKEQQYEEYKGRVGEIISSQVKRVEFGNALIDLGRAEGILRREAIIPRETIRPGDRIRCYISEVKRDPYGHQIFLSRTHPNFMAKLFTQEVPEVYDGLIEIKGVARDPGSRAKIAVASRDSSIDPVGACVGMRGSRVQAVINELQGEKIDIILWSPDIATFVVNALAPAEVARVVVEEERKRLSIVVPDDHLSQAIGRRGQNVKLASMLTGWTLDITTESDDTKRRGEEMNERSELFMRALDIDDMVARLLVSEGFMNLEEIAYVELEELTSIEGFDESLAQELQKRANDFLAQEEERLRAESIKLGMQEDLLSLEGLTPRMLLKLAKQEIYSRNDFADLATDEVLDLLGSLGVDEAYANELIMAARAHWFEEGSARP